MEDTRSRVTRHDSLNSPMRYNFFSTGTALSSDSAYPEKEDFLLEQILKNVTKELMKSFQHNMRSHVTYSSHVTYRWCTSGLNALGIIFLCYMCFGCSRDNDTGSLFNRSHDILQEALALIPEERTQTIAFQKDADPEKYLLRG